MWFPGFLLPWLSGFLLARTLPMPLLWLPGFLPLGPQPCNPLSLGREPKARVATPFPPFILLTHIVLHDLIVQPTPILPTHLEPPPRTYYPTCGHQFTLWRLTLTRILVRHIIHLNQTYMTIPAQYLHVLLTHLHQHGLTFWHWMSLSLSILAFVVLDYTTASLPLYNVMCKWHFVFH